MDGYQMFEENPRNLWFILLLAVVLSILSLCSCASLKRQRSSGIKRNTAIKNDVDQRFTHDTFLEYFQSQLKESKMNFKMSIYDSDQPVDSETGKPPLSAEIEINNKTKEQTHIQAQQKDSTDLSLKDNSTLDDKEDIIHQDNKTRYNTNHIFSLFFIGIVLFLFYRLIRK